GRMVDVELDFGSWRCTPAILLPGDPPVSALGNGRFRVRIDATGAPTLTVAGPIPPPLTACERSQWNVPLPWVPARRADEGRSFLADHQVRVELKPGTFFEDAYLWAEPAPEAPAWPAGLTRQSRVFRVEPSTLPLDQGFWLGLVPEPEAGSEGLSLYRFDGDEWSYVGSERRAEGDRSWIGSDVKRLSQFALARDTVPPAVEWVSPPAAITAISSAASATGPQTAVGARPLLRVRVRDDGAGFREDDLTFLIDGKAVPSEWDPDTGDLRYTPRKPLAPGRHVLIAQAKDRAGLVTRRERTLTVR
ncbi:MAG TPA: hypothetical protein VNM87_07775, partial [Candidatus Udaeobacter sp.]|nr:hypothetical protein [Candidatus Udaeobacter sp.]